MRRDFFKGWRIDVSPSPRGLVAVMLSPLGSVSTYYPPKGLDEDEAATAAQRYLDGLLDFWREKEAG